MKLLTHEPVAEPAKPVMTVSEFHVTTGGQYRGLPDAEVRAMIAALTVMAELACDCASGQHRPEVQAS